MAIMLKECIHKSTGRGESLHMMEAEKSQHLESVDVQCHRRGVQCYVIVSSQPVLSFEDDVLSEWS